MELNDKAYSTLAILRNATWLNSDIEIMRACLEVFDYLREEIANKPKAQDMFGKELPRCKEYDEPIMSDGQGNCSLCGERLNAEGGED